MPIVVAKEKLGRVADLMNEVVCIVDDTTTVTQARQELEGSRVTGAPVVQGETVVGVISQTDLLNAAGPQAVREVMTKTVFAVRPTDPVMLAVRLMAEQEIHRVVVVDDAGELHGILSAMDVLKSLAHDAGEVGELGYVALDREG